MIIKSYSDIVFIGYGAGVNRAVETEKLAKDDYSIVDLRFVKPLDEQLLKELVLYLRVN